MKSNQILMKGPLVTATLAGIKTETRRPIDRLLKYGRITELEQLHGGDFAFKYRRGEAWCHDILSLQQMLAYCPYGRVGDELWLRETWAGRDKGDGTYGDVLYAADFPPPVPSHPLGINSSWRPSIHMPRSVCRAFLKIVEVRLERIRDITDEGAFREGTVHNPNLLLNSLVSNIIHYGSDTALGELLIADPSLYELSDDPGRATEHERIIRTTARGCFAYVWEVCYPGSWGRDDFVWLVKFQRKTQ